MTYRQHLASLTLLAVVLGALIVGLQYIRFPYIHPTGIYWVPFFFVINGVASFFIFKALNKDQQRMVLVYLATTVFRLLISASVIFFALINGVEDRITFVINFAVVYLAFLGFEIYSLLTNLRAHLEKDTNRHGQSQL